MSAFVRGRSPSRVNLRELLKTKPPTAAQLIKGLHSAGGAPLRKSNPAVDMAQPLAKEVVVSPATPEAPRYPRMDDGSPLPASVIERLDAERAAETIRGVHAAGGYRLEGWQR